MGHLPLVIFYPTTEFLLHCNRSYAWANFLGYMPIKYRLLLLFEKFLNDKQIDSVCLFVGLFDNSHENQIPIHGIHIEGCPFRQLDLLKEEQACVDTRRETHSIFL